MATITGITTAAVLVGGLGLGAGGALTGHAPTASAATAHARHGRSAHHAALLVTRVSGTTIDARRGARTITITVGAATTYKEAGQTVPLAAVQPGERIAVTGTRSGRGAIQATVVRIVLARVAGRVTAVSGASVMLTNARGVTHTVTVGASALVKEAGQTVPLSAVQPGERLIVQGTRGSNGAIQATVVRIRLAHVAGRITAVNGGTYTLTTAHGVTHAVVTTAGTTYTAHGAATAASALTVGTRVVARGVLSSDGKTLTAVRIVVRSAWRSAATPHASA